MQRLAQKSDALAIAELDADCFGRPWDLAAVNHELARDGHLACVIQYPGQISLSGYAIGFCWGDEAELLRIAVDPRARRQGWGAALLRAWLEQAKNQGACQVFLEVAARNQAARRLYRSVGFAESGLRRGYYPALPACRFAEQHEADDAVIMRADLAYP